MKKIFLIFITIGIISLCVSFLYHCNNQLSQKKILEHEAVWIARYIDIDNIDLNITIDKVCEDRNVSIEKSNWTSIIHPSLKKSSAIICTQKMVAGQYLIIERDLSIKWLKPVLQIK